VLSRSCSLADAAATAIGNRIRSKAHIGSAIEFGKNIPRIDGIVVIAEGEIGMWGDLELVRLK
jgi:ApbE superfamily uncharacterized protein (UPF0280 family)